MQQRWMIVGAIALLLVGGLAGYLLKPSGVARETYQRLQDQNTRLETESAQRTAQLAELTETRDALQTQNEELSAQVEDLRGELDTLKSQVSVLRGENTDLSSQLESARENAGMAERLLSFFNSESPFTPVPPATAFRVFGDGSGLFLQFDSSAEGDGSLRYIGTMEPGVFCDDERTRALREQGYVHFRAAEAPSEATAAGGRPGEAGHWMRFIAVQGFEMPWGAVEPGIDFGYRPTDPPACSG